MNGVLRTFYAVAAAFASWRARRLKDAGARWLARAEDWSKRAAGSAP